MRPVKLLQLILAALLVASVAPAHDMVHEALAGPHRLTVYLNPHAVTAGVVEVAARAESGNVAEMRFALTNVDASPGEPAFATATALPVEGDPTLFRSSLAIPSQATWRIDIHASGEGGSGGFSIPVAAAAPFGGLAKGMGRLAAVAAWVLFTVCVLAVLRWFSRASSRTRRKLLPVSAAVASPWLLLGLSDGLLETVFYHPAVYQRAYQTVAIHPSVDEDGVLGLELTDPGWVKFRRFDDLVLDHGHPMHLYALRLPELDRVFHLHPEELRPGVFSRELPDMPAGRYQLVADIVHSTGLWEAPQGELELVAAIRADGVFQHDDSGGAGHGISEARFDRNSFELADGHRMIWEKPERSLRAGDPLRLNFRLEDSEGRLAPDIELYMGMLGHSVILRHDRSSFAHVHPTGSVSMASIKVLSNSPENAGRHHHGTPDLEAKVAFPYAFPKAGRYRLIVQMKHGGRVDTGFFDTEVARR